MLKKIAVSLSLTLALASAAQAQSIVGFSSITSPQGSYPYAPQELVRAIDQSGLSASYTSGVTDFASFVATTTHNSEGQGLNSGYTNTNGLPQIFSFDIGSVQSVDGFAIWANDNVGSLTAFNLYADDDNVFGNGVGSLLGSYAVSGQADLNLADIRSFSSVSTRYLQIEATAPQNYYLGIGEFALRSSAATTVPEPSTYAMMGVGLLALGVIARRRRSA